MIRSILHLGALSLLAVLLVAMPARALPHDGDTNDTIDAVGIDTPDAALDAAPVIDIEPAQEAIAPASRIVMHSPGISAVDGIGSKSIDPTAASDQHPGSRIEQRPRNGFVRTMSHASHRMSYAVAVSHRMSSRLSPPNERCVEYRSAHGASRRARAIDAGSAHASRWRHQSSARHV